MDLYEYQAKELFIRHGVPTTEGDVCTTPAEADAVAARIGGPVVVKAQVKTGGRGKAGGVKLAESRQDAREKAEAILGMDIKGHTVHRVLVAEASDIAEEYYVSFLLDRTNRSFSRDGEHRGWCGHRRSGGNQTRSPREDPRGCPRGSDSRARA